MTVENLNDRLLTLFSDWQRLRQEQDDRQADTIEAEEEARARGKRLQAIEKDLSRYAPLSSEGAAALVTVMIYWAKYGGPSEGEQERMLSNLLVWIERTGSTA